MTLTRHIWHFKRRNCSGSHKQIILIRCNFEKWRTTTNSSDVISLCNRKVRQLSLPSFSAVRKRSRFDGFLLFGQTILFLYTFDQAKGGKRLTLEMLVEAMFFSLFIQSHLSVINGRSSWNTEKFCSPCSTNVKFDSTSIGMQSYTMIMTQEPAFSKL